MAESSDPADTFDQRFGARVRALRVEAGLSQEELAYRSSFSVSNFARIERGQQGIRSTRLPDLAQGLGVDVAELFKGL